MSWLDELEIRLEQQLEAFLASNPAQDARLREQEARDRQARLIGRRRQLQGEADQLRTALLQRASDIRQWRARVERARAACAHDLAARAEAHLAALMEQGRLEWQQLEGLGQEFRQLEHQLTDLLRSPGGGPAASSGRAATPKVGPTQADLERDWAAFETQQELERMRRRQA